jgi:hypothetical protein
VSAGKTYLKCKCPHCGAEVSYPDYAGGGASGCGQCGKTVLLPRAAAAPQPAPAKPAANPAPAPKPASGAAKRVDPAAIRGGDTSVPPVRKGSFLRVCLWTLNVAIVLAVVVVVGTHLKNRPKSGQGEGSASPPPGPVQPAPAAPAPAAKSGTSPTPVPTTPPATTPATPPAPAMTPPVVPKGPKLLGDLKVTQVALDQPKGAKGSRLVYVTGVLKNDSDHQRFGVRVELDLLDATTNKVGTATDYRQMLEPRATWQFRALVTDRRTVGARLAGVKEDE